MTQDEAHAILLARFRVLEPEKRANLAWHAERGTRICCGRRHYMLFVHEDGGG